jgi:hypothetical protein
MQFILFISTSSEKSIQCLKFIKDKIRNIKIQYIILDNLVSRYIVSNPSNQIVVKGVPSLIVIEDGKFFFEGLEKVLQIISIFDHRFAILQETQRQQQQVYLQMMQASKQQQFMGENDEPMMAKKTQLKKQSTVKQEHRNLSSESLPDHISEKRSSRKIQPPLHQPELEEEVESESEEVELDQGKEEYIEEIEELDSSESPVSEGELNTKAMSSSALRDMVEAMQRTRNEQDSKMDRERKLNYQ